MLLLQRINTILDDTYIIYLPNGRNIKYRSNSLDLKLLKEFIIKTINSETDQKILEGFVWREMPIWLSSENQFNYKAAFDLAMQTQGMNLPITFKFGTTDEPIYHTFETVEELTDFYTSAVKYINDTLAEGWKLKDSINWEKYRIDLMRLDFESRMYFEELKKAEEEAKKQLEKEFE